MKVKSLRIENFRSIQSLNIDLPQVCAIVGPNNAGKSNILDALRKVLARDWGPRLTDFTEDDVYLREDRDINIECSFAPPLQYKKLKNADPIEVERLRFLFTRYKVGEQAGERRLEQSCLNGSGKTPTVQTTYGGKGNQPKFEPVVGIPQDLRETVPLIYIGTDRSLERQLPSAQYSLLRRIFEDINADLQDPSQTIVVRDRDGSTEREVPRLDRFKQLINLAMNTLKTDEFKKLEAAIKRHALEQLGLDGVSDEIDLYFTPMDTMDFYKQLDLVIKDHGFSTSAKEVGQGFQNAIVLAVLRAFEETKRSGAILLIEEPEMFLHPQMQRSLYKTLRKIGETNQVIYTTHSPHFVSVPFYEEVLLVRRGEDGTYVIGSPLASDGKRREKFLKELDPERSELFFARRLLLVEGDTEKLSLPQFANRLKLDLDRAGATIVEVGGKRNIIDFAELAISFQIPTGIIYDKDSTDFKGKPLDEAIYNRKLDKLKKDDGSVRVWQLDKKYEDVVRNASGEDKYQELCQRYPGISNATRQRLVAGDIEMPIPAQFQEALKWLVNKLDAA